MADIREPTPPTAPLTAATLDDYVSGPARGERFTTLDTTARILSPSATRAKAHRTRRQAHRANAWAQHPAAMLCSTPSLTAFCHAPIRVGHANESSDLGARTPRQRSSGPLTRMKQGARAGKRAVERLLSRLAQGEEVGARVAGRLLSRLTQGERGGMGDIGEAGASEVAKRRARLQRFFPWSVRPPGAHRPWQRSEPRAIGYVRRMPPVTYHTRDGMRAELMLAYGCHLEPVVSAPAQQNDDRATRVSNGVCQKDGLDRDGDGESDAELRWRQARAAGEWTFTDEYAADMGLYLALSRAEQAYVRKHDWALPPEEPADPAKAVEIVAIGTGDPFDAVGSKVETSYWSDEENPQADETQDDGYDWLEGVDQRQETPGGAGGATLGESTVAAPPELGTLTETVWSATAQQRLVSEAPMAAQHAIAAAASADDASAVLLLEEDRANTSAWTGVSAAYAPQNITETDNKAGSETNKAALDGAFDAGSELLSLERQAVSDAESDFDDIEETGESGKDSGDDEDFVTTDDPGGASDRDTLANATETCGGKEYAETERESASSDTCSRQQGRAHEAQGLQQTAQEGSERWAALDRLRGRLASRYGALERQQPMAGAETLVDAWWPMATQAERLPLVRWDERHSCGWEDDSGADAKVQNEQNEQNEQKAKESACAHLELQRAARRVWLNGRAEDERQHPQTAQLRRQAFTAHPPCHPWELGECALDARTHSQWLPASEVANLLEVTTSAVRHWRRRKQIPSVLDGRETYICMEDVRRRMNELAGSAFRLS